MIKANEVDRWRKAMESKDERQRCKDTKELWQIYRHQWRELLELRLRDLFSEQTWEALRLQADTSINLLNWAAGELGGAIYSKCPTRSIDGVEFDESDDDPLAPYTNDGALDLALSQAAGINYACRAVAMRPLVTGIDDEGNRIEGEEHRVTLDIIPAHRVFVVPNETDLTRIELIIIHKEDGTFVAWDKDEEVKVSASWKVESKRPNPYKRVPYVVAHAAYPTAQYWSTSEAFGLRDATYQIGVAKTEHNHLRHFQSHRQGWYRSDGELPLSVVTDPAQWLHIKGNGEAGAIDLQADLKSNLESILDAAAATLALYGIRPESVKGSLDASSGYALSLKLISQEKVWGQQRRLWEVWERQLYDIARTVLQVDAGIVLPEGKLMIDWAEVGAEATPLDKADYHEKLLNMGVVDEYWVQKQMGFTEEEIEAIEERKAEKGVGRMMPPMLQPPQPPGQPQPPIPPGMEDDPEDIEPEDELQQ